jgi:hypothetical protein
MRKIKLIEVEVLDTDSCPLHFKAKGRHLLAAERAPGIWRVKDGEFNFTFTQAELDAEQWIKDITQ